METNVAIIWLYHEHINSRCETYLVLRKNTIIGFFGAQTYQNNHNNNWFLFTIMPAASKSKTRPKMLNYITGLGGMNILV